MPQVIWEPLESSECEKEGPAKIRGYETRIGPLPVGLFRMRDEPGRWNVRCDLIDFSETIWTSEQLEEAAIRHAQDEAAGLVTFRMNFYRQLLYDLDHQERANTEFTAEQTVAYLERENIYLREQRDLLLDTVEWYAREQDPEVLCRVGGEYASDEGHRARETVRLLFGEQMPPPQDPNEDTPQELIPFSTLGDEEIGPGYW